MMKDLASNLPSTEEIIRALGLHSRSSSTHDVMPSVALFGAGILTHRFAEPLPQRTDGSFTTTVEVVGFSEVGL